jgi:glycopeptide antibiotics resistance protein
MMVYFNTPILLAGLGLIFFLLGAQWRRTHRLSYLFCYAIFALYLLALVAVVVFPFSINISAYGGWPQQAAAAIARVNWVPLDYSTIRSTDISVRFTEALLNIFMTVPFGFGVSFVARLKPWHFLWLPLLVGLGTEGSQLAVSLATMGGGSRVVDVNDLLFNAIGVWVGYSLFALFAWAYRAAARRWQPRLRGLPGYIYEVTSLHLSSPNA